MKTSQYPGSARLTHVATIGQSPPSGWRWLGNLLRVLLITGAILAVFFAARLWIPRLLAEHWRRSLATAGDERAELLVASAARLGRPGLDVLLDALGSDRERVSRAGAEWLGRQLRSWENVPNREGQRNVEALAEALAERVDSLHPAARAEAARLAAGMLRWRLDPQFVDRGRVTRCCDKILSAAGFSLPETSVAAVAAGVPAEDRPPPGEELQSPADGDAVLRFPELPRAERASPRIASRADLATSTGARLSDAPDRPATLSQAWTMRGGSLAQGRSDAPVAAAADRVASPSDSAEPETESAGEIASLSTEACFRRLHSTTGSETQAAEAELKRRGIDARQISIARRAFDPDPLVRIRLVRELPEILGIDAAGWLLKMAADESEEVRLAAITLLATGSDPQLLAQVESIARNDRDERVRRQAELLARRRDAGRR